MNGKFYIEVDCEGVACAVGEVGKGLSNGENYTFAALQATREANAAAKALFDCGATQVIVWDAHSKGVNLLYDMLDKRCLILNGCGHKGRFVGIDSSFDAVLFIGCHAKDNTRGAVLAHTYSIITYQYCKINGEEYGEIGIDAAYAGEHGVPVMFCSGDTALVNEAKALFENVAVVETKKPLSWVSALSKHPLAVCDEIYDTVKAAYSNIENLKPFTLSKPLTVELRYKRLDDAQNAVLYGRGEKFSQIDAFTRKGVLDEITELF